MCLLVFVLVGMVLVVLFGVRILVGWMCLSVVVSCLGLILVSCNVLFVRFSYVRLILIVMLCLLWLVYIVSR